MTRYDLGYASGLRSDPVGTYVSIHRRNLDLGHERVAGRYVLARGGRSQVLYFTDPGPTSNEPRSYILRTLDLVKSPGTLIYRNYISVLRSRQVLGQCLLYLGLTGVPGPTRKPPRT